MARRKKNPGLVELVLEGEWPLAAGLAVAALVALVILPGKLGASLVLRGLAPWATIVLGICTIAFAATACVKYLVARKASVDRAAGPFPMTAPNARAGRTPRVVEAEARVVEPAFRPEPHVASKPDRWSLGLLQSIDWKRFEEVVAAYFREKNFRCETIAFGADGGVDARVYFGDLKGPVGVVQCKAWGRRQVGVSVVRELLGVMTHEKVSRGYVAATGDFSDDAIRFATANPILLISGKDFIEAIASMSEEKSRRLLAVCTEGDFTTPSCPSCGDKLSMKTFRNGGSAWGCHRFPACRTRIATKTPART